MSYKHLVKSVKVGKDTWVVNSGVTGENSRHNQGFDGFGTKETWEEVLRSRGYKYLMVGEASDITYEWWGLEK